MWPPRLRTLSRCAVGSAKCMMELQDQIKAPLARSLARSFSSVLSSVSRPTTHSLPSCCFVLHCGCCCPCPLRPSSSAAVAAAAAFVWPPTVPPSPPCRRRPRRTTVSLARSLARPVGGCRISCYGHSHSCGNNSGRAREGGMEGGGGAGPTKAGFPARTVPFSKRSPLRPGGHQHQQEVSGAMSERAGGGEKRRHEGDGCAGHEGRGQGS